MPNDTLAPGAKLHETVVGGLDAAAPTGFSAVADDVNCDIFHRYACNGPRNDPEKIFLHFRNRPGGDVDRETGLKNFLEF